MRGFAGLVAALSFAGSALATSQAPAKAPCEDFLWPMKQEVAAFGGEAQNAKSGETFGTWPTGAIKLALQPIAEAGLPKEPERTPKDAAKAVAGFIELPAASAGTYTVTVAGKLWVDVIQDGATVKSTAHGSDDSCTLFHKAVRFELTAAPVTLQLSGEGAETVTFTIFPGQ